jgi:hypothetical protein
MRKILLATVMAVSVAALGACGGDDNNKASLSGSGDNSAPSVADKKNKPPAGEEAAHVGAPPSKPACGVVLNAFWTNSPKTLDDAVDEASTIVAAEVESVQKADDLVIPQKGEPGGENRVPTSEVKVRVEKSAKGSAKEGDTLTLFQTGDDCQRMDKDPPYKKGEKHLLFLEKGPRGQLRTISPEGRYKEKADGTLEPVADTPATQAVKGKKITDIEQQLK